MKTIVVNLNTDQYDIYIGRGSKWGNPFKIGKDGDRKAVIAKYREWILTQEHLLKDLGELKNKKLGCFCWPKLCHGDILVELINSRL